VGSLATAHIAVPKSGWYRLRLRYCADADPCRSLLIDGKVPFAEAEHFPLSDTGGWSTSSNDWKEVALGDDLALGTVRTPGGWRFYLSKSVLDIALRNDDGSGCNLDWIELDPQTDL